jgi:hypothetical protein
MACVAVKSSQCAAALSVRIAKLKMSKLSFARLRGVLVDELDTARLFVVSTGSRRSDWVQGRKLGSFGKTRR